jgi:hypothetical protein
LAELVDLLEGVGIKVVLARFHRTAVAGIARTPELDDRLLDLMAHRPSDAARQARRDTDQSDDRDTAPEDDEAGG